MKDLQRKYCSITSFGFCVLAVCCQPAIAGQARQKPRAATADQLNPIAKRVRDINSLADSKSPAALPEIRKALSSSQWYERGAAALALARIAQRDALPELSGLLQDENWFVRDSAIEALVVAGDPAAATPIEKLLEAPDPFTRARAASALGRLNSTATVPSLIKVLQDGSPQVRRAAAAALGELKASPAADNLIALLKDQDAGVRAAAAVSLGRIGDTRAAASVEAALENGADDEWRYAGALCRLGKHEYLNRLTSALKSPYRETRAEAFAFLMDLADPRSLPALAEAMRPGVQDHTSGTLPAAATSDLLLLRVAYARGLVRFEGTEARDALISLTEDPEPAVRVAAVSSLAARARFAGSADPAAIGALVALLKREQSSAVVEAVTAALPSFDRDKVSDSLLAAIDTDPKSAARIREALKSVDITVEKLAPALKSNDVSTQIAALDKLERLRDPGTTQALIDLLEGSSDTRVRVRAAASLGALRDRRATESLIAAARAPQTEVRVAAITALGKIGDYSAADTLLEASRDNNSAVREAAATALGALGVTVERVSADLSNSNWQVRAAAIASLARLGDTRAVPGIVALLRDPNPRVRAEATRALSVFGDARAVDPLIDALGDQNADVRLGAATSLAVFKQPRAIGPLTALLGDRDASVSAAAAESLARMDDSAVIRRLVESLSSSDWHVRARAAQVLAGVPTAAASGGAIGALVNAMRDRDLVVRYYAGEALVGIGASAVHDLMSLLQSPQQNDRARVARVLIRIGSPAVAPLIAAVRDKSGPVESRADAALILGRLGDPAAIDALAQLLEDERYQLREAGSRALSQIGEPAVDRLILVTKSSDRLISLGKPSVAPSREAAIQALGAIGTPAVVDVLIKALSDPASGIRNAAVKALGETRSELAVAPLMMVLLDESSSLRSPAAAALARLGRIALPGLTTALRDTRPSVRVLAAQALGEAGLKESVPALIDLAKTDSSAARGDAIEALGRIGDPVAIDAITGGMSNGSVVVRRKAARALASLRDSRVVAALITGLADRDAEVRQSAATGLAEIADASVISRLEQLAENDASADVRTAAATSAERVRARNSKPSAAVPRK